MCNIKVEFVDRIWKMCDGIGFCLDYYSIGDKWEDVVSKVRMLYPKASFEYSNPTEEDWTIINVDSIAHNLSLPISDITKHKCYKFQNVMFGGQEALVYINQYFLFVFIKVYQKKVELNWTENDKSVIGALVKSTDIFISNILCSMNCGMVCSLNEINDMVDERAFPNINDKDIINSSYVDTRKYHDCIVYMLRVLRKPKNGDRYEMTIHLQSEYFMNVSKDIFNIYSKLLKKTIENATTILKQDESRKN